MLAEKVGADALEVPVRWSSPQQLLGPRCVAGGPDVIISMGEGRDGWFDIETTARNTRLERPDNDGKFPEGAPIFIEGPDMLHAGINGDRLRHILSATGLPVRVSRDAGAFLCEEIARKRK